MLVLGLSLLALFLEIKAVPVRFPGNFTLSQTLKSASVSLPQDSMIYSSSVQTQSIQTETLTAASRITVTNLYTNLLVATGGSLAFTGLIQVTGSVSQTASPPQTTTSTAFIETPKADEQHLRFSSFLGSNDDRYLSDLEDQLNRVGRRVYRSFLELPSDQWTLFGLYTTETIRLTHLPKHRKLLFRTNVRFTSPEWAGGAVTFYVFPYVGRWVPSLARPPSMD